MTPARDPTPSELITYRCTRCQWEFSRTELQQPTCTVCAKGDCLDELKREPITPQVMEEGMMRSMEHLLTSLEKTYAEAGTSDENEELLLDAMSQTQDLQIHIHKVFNGSRKKTPRVHGVFLSL